MFPIPGKFDTLNDVNKLANNINKFLNTLFANKFRTSLAYTKMQDNRWCEIKLNLRLGSEEISCKPMEEEFNLFVKKLGISKKITLGQIFKLRGHTYELVGYKKRNSVYPFIAKRTSNGRNYKFSVNQIERYCI